MTAFLQELAQLGWIDGRNARVDTRWGVADVDRIRKYAAELVALAPDVIWVNSSAALAPLLQATRTVPIVFTGVTDPVGAGFVDSLARPGGNATGFAVFEYSISAKWLELLKEIAPRVTRAAVLRESAVVAGPAEFGIIQAAAPSLGVELRPVDVRNASEIERALTAFAQGSNGGLIVTGSPGTLFHRALIVALAARHKLPAVYWARRFVTDGGLISYGPDISDQYRKAAGYVDRILKGEKPADLPVQTPTKYELVINPKNLKNARPRPASIVARPRRRGDRITAAWTHVRLLHLLTAGYGTTRTRLAARINSANRGKADSDAAARGGLRSTPDCRPRRAYLHLSYSYASPFGPALLVTQDP
jgi:putative tryptophan/tyrosine transport system substrate-binding protein